MEPKHVSNSGRADADGGAGVGTFFYEEKGKRPYVWRGLGNDTRKCIAAVRFILSYS